MNTPKPQLPPEYELLDEGASVQVLARFPGGAYHRSRDAAVEAARAHRHQVEQSVLAARPDMHAMANAIQHGMLAVDAALIALPADSTEPLVRDARTVLLGFRKAVETMRKGGATNGN